MPCLILTAVVGDAEGFAPWGEDRAVKGVNSNRGMWLGYWWTWALRRKVGRIPQSTRGKIGRQGATGF